MPTFASIRDIPQTGLSEWESAVLNAMKENIEILMGQRASGVRAITSDTVTVQQQDVQQMKQVTATGAGYTISGVTVAALDDHVKLINNVQQLANDVASLQQVVNVLIGQLRS